LSYSKNAWDQIKSISAREIMSALVAAGWSLDSTNGSIHTYSISASNSRRRVQVHFHGGGGNFGPKLLQKMLAEIGWDEADLRRLKLIK